MSNSINKFKIAALELPELNSSGFKILDDDSQSHEVIEKLGDINIFIGSNNTGKSRFMRFIANTQPLRFSYRSKDFAELGISLNAMQEDFEKNIRQHRSLNGVADIKFEQRKIDIANVNFPGYAFKYLEAGQNPYAELLSLLRSFLNQSVEIASYRPGRRDINTLRTLALEFAGRHKQTISILEEMEGDIPHKPVCYIPTIRTLNEFGAGSGTDKDDFIGARVRQNYLLAEHVNIFTGQTIYKRIRNMLLGDHEEREKIKEYEKFLSEKLFDQKPITLIPKEGSDVVTIRIGEEEKEIYNVGDGIQTLIILTFPLYEYDKALFFIEEPEVNLHPAMQRKLLEAFQDKSQHQYFLTTHSNHFLDLTIQYDDISVFLCKRPEKSCDISLVAYGDRSILEEIGVQNTSVFLTNKTIWVEGITDRFYLAKLLELYISHNLLPPILEDQDYSYVEYGGNNITHWSFIDKLADTHGSTSKINAKRLCGQMILIADSDAANTKQSRKDLLKQELGDRFIELGVREVENLLRPKTIAQVIADYEKKETEIFKGVNQQWYSKKLLGEYIDKRFADCSIISARKSYQAESGTIKDKLSFCKKALKYIKTYEDLSPEAQELAKSVYTFIRE